MTNGPLLSVTGVSKKYSYAVRQSLWYGLKDMACELVPWRARDEGLRASEFWALDDVSFELGRGESLAVIGDNGAGKSTLLKLLCGLLKPDRGEVRFRGRMEALIELGTGMNSLLTGRENIVAGARFHGLDRRATSALLDVVIDFSELGDVIDAPMQSYSSGMRARLAYALAAHLDPELLLVDEVLAVGDHAFQRKCITHMHGYLHRGGSLLFVSHNPFQIQAVCESGILLDRGRVTFRGTAVETLNTMFEQRLEAKPAADDVRPAENASAPVVIDEVRAEPISGEAIVGGEPVRIVLRYRVHARMKVLWGFTIWTADRWVCVAGEFDPSGCTLNAGEGALTCLIPRLPLVGGTYGICAAIADYSTQQPLALFGYEGGAAVLNVRSNPTMRSNVHMAMNQLVTMDVEWT
jgi:ABC-type polysaccharide/polyol phosphate transport system ATPase subunit